MVAVVVVVVTNAVTRVVTAAERRTKIQIDCEIEMKRFMMFVLLQENVVMVC